MESFRCFFANRSSILSLTRITPAYRGKLTMSEVRITWCYKRFEHVKIICKIYTGPAVPWALDWRWGQGAGKPLPELKERWCGARGNRLDRKSLCEKIRKISKYIRDIYLKLNSDKLQQWQRIKRIIDEYCLIQFNRCNLGTVETSTRLAFDFTKEQRRRRFQAAFPTWS